MVCTGDVMTSRCHTRDRWPNLRPLCGGQAEQLHGTCVLTGGSCPGANRLASNRFSAEQANQYRVFDPHLSLNPATGRCTILYLGHRQSTLQQESSIVPACYRQADQYQVLFTDRHQPHRLCHRQFNPMSPYGGMADTTMPRDSKQAGQCQVIKLDRKTNTKKYSRSTHSAHDAYCLCLYWLP